MRRRTSLFLLTAVLAVTGFVVPETAEAQYGRGYGYRPRPVSPRWGFRHRLHGYIGGQVMGMGILHQQLDNAGTVGPGGGVGLFGGVRLSPFVGLELNWTFTAHDEAWEAEPGVTVVDLDALQIQTLTGDFKLHIPTRGIVEPFFQAGIGFAFFGVTGDYGDASYILSSGPAFNLGGGLDIWLGPWFTLGGRVLYRGMYFREPGEEWKSRGADENYVSGVSIDLCGTIHF
jgi:hypothetical protein